MKINKTASNETSYVRSIFKKFIYRKYEKGIWNKKILPMKQIRNQGLFAFEKFLQSWNLQI